MSTSCCWLLSVVGEVVWAGLTNVWPVEGTTILSEPAHITILWSSFSHRLFSLGVSRDGRLSFVVVVSDGADWELRRYVA